MFTQIVIFYKMFLMVYITFCSLSYKQSYEMIQLIETEHLFPTIVYLYH